MGSEIKDIMKEGKDLWWNGMHAEAAHVFRRALERSEILYGRNAPEVISPLYWLSSSLALSSGEGPSEQRADAAALLRRALGTAETHFGSSDRRLINILSALALDLDMLEMHSEAYDHIARALKISEIAYGERGDTLSILGILTELLLKLDRPAEALPFAERALRLQEPRTSELSWIGIGYACRALGRCLMGIGRNEEAIAYLERCLALFKARHPGKKISLEDELLGWIEDLRKRS